MNAPFATPNFTPVPIEESGPLLISLVAGAVQAHASDLHLRAGAVPFMRVDGHLTRVNAPTLNVKSVESLLGLLAGRSPPDADTFEFSYEQPQVVRFRGHAFRESGHWAVSLRVVPLKAPSLIELRVPPIFKALCEVQPGLTLLTGPAGSGRSTTAAAMLRVMASAGPLHVVTVEDPAEYCLTDTPSCISQREVGRDTPSFSHGLAAALREDPDVLFVSEIHDFATLDLALQAAENGVCVLSTFHTSSALKTIQRLLSLAPPELQLHARGRLADSLRAVVSQRLLPRKSARGRVLCSEVMLNSAAVTECIRDGGKTQLIPSVIERSSDQQMQLFDKQLVALVREGQVSAEVALAYAVAPVEVRRLLGAQGHA